MKPAICKMEFYSDANGAVYTHIWNPVNGWERDVPWSGLVSRKELRSYFVTMYKYIRQIHPYHAERADAINIKSNLTSNEMFLYLRKFIAYYMADDDETEYDYVEYADGTSEINIERRTCADLCPILKGIENNIAFCRAFVSKELNKEAI
ncbi:MAG: hypothetical protein JXK07_10170 [Spirochaetes bacterium]|nr:hypothetical protein [Spirochaetota bacterium]MBN2771236.1 hypothetical protein [Spirochaetota bacterium]